MAAATADLYMYPPKEFYKLEDNIVWKAVYGLCSSPHAWQKHLPEVLQQIGLHRSTAEPNIYMTAAPNCFVLAYIDDLLSLVRNKSTTSSSRGFNSTCLQETQ